jgi:hypothetical protein
MRAWLLPANRTRAGYVCLLGFRGEIGVTLRRRGVDSRGFPPDVPRGFAKAAHPDHSQVDVEQSYSTSFKKLLALSWIAFIASLGPFHPMISSFLSSSSSVAMKNFSSSC